MRSIKNLEHLTPEQKNEIRNLPREQQEDFILQWEYNKEYMEPGGVCDKFLVLKNIVGRYRNLLSFSSAYNLFQNSIFESRDALLLADPRHPQDTLNEPFGSIIKLSIQHLPESDFQLYLEQTMEHNQAKIKFNLSDFIGELFSKLSEDRQLKVLSELSSQTSKLDVIRKTSSIFEELYVRLAPRLKEANSTTPASGRDSNSSFPGFKKGFLLS